MLQETVSIIIMAPVEEVFSFLSVPANRLIYDPDLIDVRHSPDGPLRVGSEIVEVRSMMGIKGESITEVSEYEQGRIIAYRSKAGDPVNASGSYQFTTVAEGTLLTLEFTLNPRGIMKLLLPLIGRGMRQNIESGLRNIKAVLENQ